MGKETRTSAKRAKGHEETDPKVAVEKGEKEQTGKSHEHARAVIRETSARLAEQQPLLRLGLFPVFADIAWYPSTSR